MISLSIAIVIITTEILGTIIYLKRKNEKVGISEKNIEIISIEEKIKSLEDQVSSIRLSISMRRKDG